MLKNEKIFFTLKSKKFLNFQNHCQFLLYLKNNLSVKFIYNLSNYIMYCRS